MGKSIKYVSEDDYHPEPKATVPAMKAAMRRRERDTGRYSFINGKLVEDDSNDR